MRTSLSRYVTTYVTSNYIRVDRPINKMLHSFYLIYSFNTGWSYRIIRKNIKPIMFV